VAEGASAVQRLADRLRFGVEAMRAGRPADAVDALAEVCADHALADATDLDDVRARALSLYGQALVLTGRADEALTPIEAALQLAYRAGDTEGVHEIEALREQARKARVGAAARPPSASADAIEASGLDPVTRADLLLQKASAEIDAGRAEVAADLARRALVLAPRAPRVAVLARVCLARCAPGEEAALLEEAAEIARDADEHTLLGLIARAAEAAGVVLENQRGPDTVRARPDQR
jgi:hypothetical protein